MNKVVHFEIPADDLKRAQDFYKNCFGWKIVEMPEFNYTIVHSAPTDENNMITEPGAINGGMSKRSETFRAPNIVIDVESIEEKLGQIEAAGGKTLMAKMPVGEMGFVAYFQDTEGNSIGLWETPKK